MSLTVSQESGELTKTLVPEGPHVARCTAVIDIGTQEQEWQGETKTKRQVVLSWEFPEHTAVFNEADGPQPLGRSKRYNASLHEKATLRKHLVNWRGRQFTPKELDGFDLNTVVGHPCLATIIHTTRPDGTTTDKIDSVGAIPKGLSVPDAVNEPYVYDIDQHPRNWDRVPKWIQDEIQKSPEFKRVTNTSAPASEPEVEEEVLDEVPF